MRANANARSKRGFLEDGQSIHSAMRPHCWPPSRLHRSAVPLPQANAPASDSGFEEDARMSFFWCRYPGLTPEPAGTHADSA